MQRKKEEGERGVGVQSTSMLGKGDTAEVEHWLEMKVKVGDEKIRMNFNGGIEW